MITQEDAEKIQNIFYKGLGKEIRSIRILMNKVLILMEKVDTRAVEQQELVTNLIEVLELQQHKINHLEEEVKQLKKAMQS